MPFDGNGQYDPPSPEYPAVAGTVIEAADRNAIDLDIATALSNCVTRNGQSPPTTSLPMGGQKLTGLAAGSGVGDSVRYEQLTAQAAGTGIAWTGPQDFSAAVLTATTQAALDSTTKVATTQFVANAAFTSALPLQTGNAGKFVTTDGTNASWSLVPLTTGVSGILPVANGGSGVGTSTGTGNVVLSTSPTLVTPILGTPTSGNAINLTNTIAPQTAAAAAKATPVDADTVPLVDSVDANSLKSLSWGNIKAGIFTAWGALVNGGASKVTPVDADALALMDSAAGNATKKLTWVNLKDTLKTYFDTLYRPVGVNAVVRAWAFFDGTAGGTNAPTAGKNVTSITRNSGGGNYTVNLAVVMASTNYSVVCTASAASGSAGRLVGVDTRTTGSFRILTENTGGVVSDSAIVSFHVIEET